MKQETITILEYGAYKFEYEISVVVSESVKLEDKIKSFGAKCSCIIDKSEYDETSKEVLINAIRRYCWEIIQLKKINSIVT